MRSQKGIGLVQLVIFVIALMLIAGTATYVALTSDAFVQKPETVVQRDAETETANEVNG